METIIKKAIRYSFGKLGFALVKKESFARLIFHERLFKIYDNLNLYYNISKTQNISRIFENLAFSQSQTFQDLFVLDQLDFKIKGYFIEFGALDGKDSSNTYILEKKFGWNGIVAEPSKEWQKKLELNRNCEIDKRCVWTHSGQKIEFLEISYSGLSTISQFQYSDSYNRKKNKKYHVESISLNDLLEEYRAPKKIDYLSIDTEGSEFQILQRFDFSKYEIKIITVEHNYTNQREKISNLLASKGYKRVFKELSQQDDWYILDKKN